MGVTYYFYILLAVVVLEVALVSLKVSFWNALVHSVGLLLACLFAVRFIEPIHSTVADMVGSQSVTVVFVDLLIGYVISCAVLIAVAMAGVKAKGFFDGSVNLLFSLLLILAVAGIGFVIVSALGVTYNAASQMETAAANQQPAADPAVNPQGGVAAPAAPAVNPIPGKMTEQALSYLVLLVFSVCYILWSHLGAWTNNDAKVLKLKGAVGWNIFFVIFFPGSLAVAILLPILAVRLALPAIGVFLPALIYVVVRNQGLPSERKVMTPSHIKAILTNTKRVVREEDELQGPSIELFGWGKEVPKAIKDARTEAVRKEPGYQNLCELVYNAVKRKATSVRISATAVSLDIEFFLDGFWHPITDIYRSPLSQDDIVRFLSAMKVLIGGNPEEHVARQAGRFYMEYDKKHGKKKKMAAGLLLQGKGPAEEILIQFEFLHLRFGTLERIGMSPQRVEQVEKLLKSDKGLIVFSALPGQGQTTLTNIALTASDRFTRDYVAVEDIQKPYWVIENVQLNTYDSAKGENPMTILPDVFFREPRVLVLRDMVNVETFTRCCQELKNDRLIFTAFRGRDAADTILRMLKTGIDRRLLADSLNAVICQRLVRNLCPACKEEIPANPEILRRLGISPNLISTLYRKRVRPPVEPGQKINYIPCADCLEIGYHKRTGIYDILVMTDELRQVIAGHPTEEDIRRAAAASGQRGFLPDGARLVANGTTSFEELIRALK